MNADELRAIGARAKTEWVHFEKYEAGDLSLLNLRTLANLGGRLGGIDVPLLITEIERLTEECRQLRQTNALLLDMFQE